MVDDNSGSDVVATLDVVTGYGGNVLATRQVRRSDFTSANQWQTFTLQFDNPCFGTFEARVWWAGNANMKFARNQIWGQACDFAILWSREFSRLALASDITTSTKPRALNVCI